MTRASFQHALEEILDVPRASLKETESRDTLPDWTSLADVQILTMIESEFGLEPDVELLGAETIGDLMRVLDDRGVFT
jgi:acyl carrier protein